MYRNEIEIIRRFNGGIRFRSGLFNDIDSPRYKRFLDNVCGIKGVETIETSCVTKSMRILYQPEQIKEKALLKRLEQVGKEAKKKDSKKTGFIHAAVAKGKVHTLNRYGDIVTGWQIKHALAGRLRIQHRLLYRKKGCLDYLQERLLKTPGIEKVKGNLHTQSLLILYREEKIAKERILSIAHLSLTEALAGVKKKDPFNTRQSLAVTSLGLAAAGDYFFPWLVPLNTVLVWYSAKPTFDQAKENILKKRKCGLEVLDSLVLLGCLGTGQVFAAALMSFLVCMGRGMLNEPSEESKRFLSRVIYKVPRFAWLVKGKTKVEVCIDDLKEGDKIVLEKGDIAPIDGIITSGAAVIDERHLTGQLNAAVQKKRGNELFASTRVLTGKVYLKVRKPVKESVMAELKETVLNATQHKVNAHHIGERVQEKAVIPTLGASLLGYGLGGFDSAMAIVTADYGTGIKTTAPMGFLAALGIATKQGIFIKNALAFERLAGVTTVVFKERDGLTKKEWEVKDIFKFNSISKEEILGYAAAGAGAFYTPLTRALLRKSKEEAIDIPYNYRVNGSMITSGGLDLTVGNYLLLEAYGIAVPDIVKTRANHLKSQNRELVFVALDKYLVGAVEMGRNGRFIAEGVIQELRKKGIAEMYFLARDSADIDQELAPALKIENYFAGISSPEENRLMQGLRRQDKKVAVISHYNYEGSFRPEVTICLNGLTDIRQNKADIILRKEDFLKLPLAWEISRNLRRNTRRTIGLIAVPNTICICGAMFGLLGFVPSMLLNSSCNFVATLSNSIPLYRTYEEELQEEHSQKKHSALLS